MKITKSQLKRIIKEELTAVLEAVAEDDYIVYSAEDLGPFTRDPSATDAGPLDPEHFRDIVLEKITGDIAHFPQGTEEELAAAGLAPGTPEPWEVDEQGRPIAYYDEQGNPQERPQGLGKLAAQAGHALGRVAALPGEGVSDVGELAGQAARSLRAGTKGEGRR